jgi:hypothetical protein
LCPVMFDSIGANTLYIFAGCNALTIPMVWALYPETNQRTLEEIDLLFASDSIWNWEAEKNFARLKAQGVTSEDVQATTEGSDAEKGATGRKGSVLRGMSLEADDSSGKKI